MSGNMSKKMSRMAARSGKDSSAMSSNSEMESSFDTDWRESRTAAQCVSHLCFSEHLSDISFTFSDDKSVKLPAHKFVLSMRSDVFEAMFYGSLAEGGETVLIKDVNPDVMKTVLRFVYTDKPEIDGNNVLPCLYAAKKYNLSGLVKQCSDFLQNNIDEDNVCQIIEDAIFYQMNPLQERCLLFIMDNASEVLSAPGFIELSHATLLNILKRDELASEEIDVFKAAVKWAEHNCESKSGQKMRDQLGEALYQIRFPNIPIEDFERVVTPSGILTKKEIVVLYQFNATKRSTLLGKFRQEKRPRAPVTVDMNMYIKRLGQEGGSLFDMPEYGYRLERPVALANWPRHHQDMGQFAGCVLNIQCYEDFPELNRCNLGKRQVEPRGECPQLKYVTGTFVGKVKRISTSGGNVTDYKINGDKIIFFNPINICGNTDVQFHFNEEAEGHYQMGYFQSSHVTYNCNISERIKGRNITITSIPDGLETASFVKK